MGSRGARPEGGVRPSQELRFKRIPDMDNGTPCVENKAGAGLCVGLLMTIRPRSTFLLAQGLCGCVLTRSRATVIVPCPGKTQDPSKTL